jgi:hypothetical protein
MHKGCPAVKTVVIVGTNHRVQGCDYKDTQLFKQVLVCLLTKHSDIDSIFEEWEQPKLWSTVGCNLAHEQNLPWDSVGTPNEPRFEAYGVLREPSCSVAIPMYGPIQNQVNREQFFIKKINEIMANHNHGLFICGLNHVHSMSEKLTALGFGVETYTWQEPILCA